MSGRFSDSNQLHLSMEGLRDLSLFWQMQLSGDW